MEERQSRLSSMVWRRLRPYFCVRLILLNSMFSNFCHVLKTPEEIEMNSAQYSSFLKEEIDHLNIVTQMWEEFK